MKTLLLVIFSIFIFLGCQGPEKSTCVEQDWYEIGRRSGLTGEIHRDLANDFSGCSESSKGLARSFFINGRNFGLAQYCHPENAFELGKANQEYRQVCPPQLEEDFLKSYKKGIKFFQLKTNNATLKKKLDPPKIQNKMATLYF